jgi:hypothetical protein
VRVGRRPTPLDKERLAVVESLLRKTAAAEAGARPNGHRLPRRVIGVNVIYNCYWPLFTDHIAANLNPFCSQVLAGNPRAAPSFKDKIVRLRGRRSA